MIAVILSLATAATVAAGFAFADDALLAAWRLAVTLTGGIAVGALGLLAIGRLLANDWHDAIKDELLPMAATAPLLAILAAPLILAAPDTPAALFGEALTPARAVWFQPEARQWRLAVCLLAWLVATVLLVRSERHAAAAIALALTVAGALVATVDWVMVAQPLWWSNLLPFCVSVTQLGGALALAYVVNLLQRETLDDAPGRSLASGLVALALLGLWVWYAQFLTAWNGDLPAEARWYAARMGPGAPLLAAAAAAQAAGAAVLVVLSRKKWTMLAAAALMLFAYVAHGLWLLRPARMNPATPLDLAVLAGVTALWLAWLAWAAALHDRRRAR